MEQIPKKEYRGLRDLKVFQSSYRLALEVFEATKMFPKEEKYSLVDQVRRSSRSVSANIAEAWYKRRYPKSFASKLVDSASEAGETEVWIALFIRPWLFTARQTCLLRRKVRRSQQDAEQHD